MHALLQSGYLTLSSAADSLLQTKLESDHVIDTLSSLIDIMSHDLSQYLTLRRLEAIYHQVSLTGDVNLQSVLEPNDHINHINYCDGGFDI